MPCVEPNFPTKIWLHCVLIRANAALADNPIDTKSTVELIVSLQCLDDPGVNRDPVIRVRSGLPALKESMKLKSRWQRSSSEMKDARVCARRARMLNQILTWFSQDAWQGVQTTRRR